MTRPRTRAEIAREVHERLERARASEWATGPWRDPRRQFDPAGRSEPRAVELPVQRKPPSPPRTWWRTLSEKDSLCGECGRGIPAGDRFIYEHENREVRCRSCGADRWGEARPSRALKAYAEKRRRDQDLAA
jgi:hypothetical protein